MSFLDCNILPKGIAVKLFDDKEIILSTEDVFNVEKELKNSDELLTLVDELVNSIKKDVVLKINNDLLFKVKPYKICIQNIDKYLSKKYGLKITHIPSDNTYEAYTKDSFLSKALMNVIFNKVKNKENILKEVSDQLPKVTKSKNSYKASGKNEEALVTYVKADFYNMVITEEATSEVITKCILAEINIVLENIMNMRNTVKDLSTTVENIKKNGVDKLLLRNGYNTDGMSDNEKMKAIVNIILDKYSNNSILINKYNVFNNLSTEDMGDGRNKLPWGTRLSYLFLLLLGIAIIITIVAAGLTNFILIGYALIAYIIYMVLYAFTRIILIITTGYDIKETPDIKNISRYDMLKNILLGDAELNKKDKDLAKTSKENSKFINELKTMYNGDFSSDVSNESIENIDIKKYAGDTI